MKYLLLFFCFSWCLIHAQIPTGQWRLHAANKGLDIAVGDGRVFAALETGLIEYDINEKESSLWTDVNVLSDINVTCVYYHELSNSFFVGYDNGNIDRIQGSTVTNIPAIQLAQIQGNKRVFSFEARGSVVYAASAVGVVLINTQNNEIIDTYYPSNGMEDLLSVAFTSDSIYVLTPTKLYKASSSNAILADPSQWTIDARVPIQVIDTIQYRDLISVNNQLYVLEQNAAYGLDSVFRVTNSGLVDALNLGFGLEIQDLKWDKNEVLVTAIDGVFRYNTAFVMTGVYNNFGSIGNFDCRAAAADGDVMYVADYNNGIIRFDGNGASTLSVSGPPRNSFFALDGKSDKVAIAAGSIDVVSYTFNPDGVYVFENEDWTHIYKGNQTALTSNSIFDYSAVSISPLDENVIAISTYSPTPLVITKDGKTVSEVFDLNNSELDKQDAAIYTCVSDIEYDSKGNLWVLNCNSMNPLKVYTKDGDWLEFNIGSGAQNKFSNRMVIDQNGTKWMSIFNSGLYAFNDNATLSDPSDDNRRNLTESEGNGALPELNVTALAVDQDNELWIGTPNGFAVLYNTGSVFGAAAGEYDAQRIKFEGENGIVNFVLGYTSITDIEVDGGNRKWMGTENAGIFLLSADGSEVLASYTKENSPLISNNIVDMEFNDKTGELFIVTDIGMVSLRTDASKGDPNYEDVSVFPNPVKPGFNGWITIQGIKGDSDVKITDVAGNLVYATQSNGGTAVWNGKTVNGENVKPGTYLIWTASTTEKGRKVGKVVVLH